MLEATVKRLHWFDHGHRNVNFLSCKPIHPLQRRHAHLSSISHRSFTLSFRNQDLGLPQTAIDLITRLTDLTDPLTIYLTVLSCSLALCFNPFI